MEAALLAIVAQLGIALGEEAATFLTVFVQGFLTLRFEKGSKGLILPQLVHWWMVAADTQRHEDGTLYTGEEKHAYVKNIMDVWANGVGLDLKDSFKDALIKVGMMQRLKQAGTDAVQVVTQAAGDAVKGEVQNLVGVAKV